MMVLECYYIDNADQDVEIAVNEFISFEVADDLGIVRTMVMNRRKMKMANCSETPAAKLLTMMKRMPMVS